MKNRWKRWIGLLLCIMLISGQVSVTSFAADSAGETEGWESWAELGSASRTISGDYKVTSDTAISADAGKNGLVISGEVRIYIASDVTLTVRGGNGSYATPGGAGIYLGSGNKLEIFGSGTLYAYGGAAGRGGNGSSGGNASGSGTAYGYPGTGGQGGTGGGGAGAGIGTSGGRGGSGGSTAYQYSQGGHDQDGWPRSIGGNRGSAGSSSASMGSLSVRDSVTVVASGGSYGINGSGGSGGAYSYHVYGNSWFRYAGAGGGGGGGGGGYSAQAIGAGGAGGGGGGAGSTGAVKADTGYPRTICGTGGNGGGGGSGGGGAGYPGNNDNSSEWLYGSASSGSTRYGGTSSSRGVRSGIYAGYPGYGGNAGSTGGNGTIYREDTAAINGSTGANITVMYKLVLNAQNGSADTSFIGINGSSLPDSVAVPSRSGYTFAGYYTAVNGEGTQYYDADGKLVGSPSYNASRSVFANWVLNQSTVTVDPNGGIWKGSGESQTLTENYGTAKVIEAPVREGYVFGRWYLSGDNGSFNQNTGTYTFGPASGTGPVLTALWYQASNVGYDILGKNGTGSGLEDSMSNTVDNSDRGVTDDELSIGSVQLKLVVNERDAADAPNSDKIEGIKQGDDVQYYDVVVEKTVTTIDGSKTTRLSETPEPVTAVIPLPTELQGRTSYAVYRYHDYGLGDDTEPEALTNDRDSREFYEVSGSNLTLHVRRFSTYAVVANEKAFTGSGTLGESSSNTTGSGLDVQGKVFEGTRARYKLDISWGPMKFHFNAAGNSWDPVDHIYVEGGSQGWTDESFADGNNKITVVNHSNADVILNFTAAAGENMSGVTMTVNETNSIQGARAADLLLEKVQFEGADPYSAAAYLWLSGTPDHVDLLPKSDENYMKAGVITVTAEAAGGSLTPKTTEK